MISSPGIGSGLDVNGIVDRLTALERRPIVQLEAAKTRLNTQLSSYGLLQNYLGNLQSAAEVLARPALWDSHTATSSDAAVKVAALPSAVPASYSIEVSQLAASQSLSSAVFANPADLGSGTLTITRGGTSVDVVIDPTQTSLQAVRDQINRAGAGVTAAIVQDSSGPLLVFTGTDTGAAHAVSISVSGATGALASLSYPGSLTERRAAVDAVYSINNVPLSSPSNRLAGVLDGVDLTLSSVTTAPVQIDVVTDNEALTKGIKDFVAAYNEINGFLASQTRYEESSKTAGALQGDRAAVGLLNKLRAQVQLPSAASAVFGRLSDLGISMERNGSLKVDDNKLSAALANPGEVAKAFSTATTGIGHGFKALADSMLNTGGVLVTRSESLRESIRRNEREQERVEDRVSRVRERLLRQYTALDNTVNQLSGLNNLVTQQLDALANTSRYISKG